MARKKQEPLEGLGRDPENKLTVQKSRPLTALWQSDLTLAEFKILDTYLSRIDSHKPERRVVVLEKGEIERCLGVKRIRKEELAERIVHLGQGIKVPDEHSKNGFRVVWLFEEAECKQDENGIWQVRLESSKKAMQYFFNVEKLGYLRYKLRCVTSIQSRYTYIMFIYLEANRYRATWEVDLEELKQILNCHEDDLYSEYKRFNERILKRCQKELTEKTECRFTYEPIRKGRSVSSIRFKLEMLSPKLDAVDPDQMSMFDLEDEDGLDDEKVDELQEARDRRGDVIGCGFDDKFFDEFTDEELIELRSLAFGCVDPADVDRHNYHLKDRRQAQDYAISEYIVQKIKAMNVYDKRTPIKDRYSYLKKSIAKEKKSND